MKFFLRHWYDIAGAAVIPVLLWAWLGDWSTIQLILLLNFAVLLIHQFEEYRFPGGEPWILNEVLMPQKGAPADRLPTNMLSGIWINGTAWILYLVAVFFPDQIWLGLAPVLFGFPAQFIAHAIVTNVRLKTFYNPGAAAVVFGHTPLAIWYFIEVYQQGLIHWTDWVFSILVLAVYMGVVFMLIGFRILGRHGADAYPYPLTDYLRWDRERRLTRAGITPRPIGQ